MKNTLTVQQKINVRSHYVGLNTNIARVAYIVTTSIEFSSQELNK